MGRATHLKLVGNLENLLLHLICNCALNNFHIKLCYLIGGKFVEFMFQQKEVFLCDKFILSLLVCLIKEENQFYLIGEESQI